MLRNLSHGNTVSALGDLLLISLATCSVYLPFLGIDTFNGNEPIRVIIAREMLETGNWAMPLLHGKLYLIKPPLMSWLIAVSGVVFGAVNEWTARLPSVLAVLLTGYAVYFFTSPRLTRGGRLFASLALVTMVGLITKGMSAEIDSLFILLTSSALLTWFYGYTQQGKPVHIWIISLSITGIGLLTKGPQGIAYFYFTVFAYLLCKRNLRFFFSLSHLAGLICFASILGIYLLTVFQYVSPHAYFQMWKNEIMQRGSANHSSGFLRHLVWYPAESFLSFLPWTLGFLPLIVIRELRTRAKELLSNDLFLFAFIMIAANFPLYWLLPGARVRYILPVGPFVAIMLACLFEWYQQEAARDPGIQTFFKKFFVVLLSVATLSALSIIPAVLLLKFELSLHLIFLVSTLMLIILFLWFRQHILSPASITLSIVVFTGFLILGYNAIEAQSEEKRRDAPQKIARAIHNILPADTGTVYEIGYDRFLEITCYLSQEVIQLDSFDQLTHLAGRQNVYFIFDTVYRNKRKKSAGIDPLEHIPWEQVYAMPYENSEKEIVVGHLREDAVKR